jgi:hypothetical protein
MSALQSMRDGWHLPWRKISAWAALLLVIAFVLVVFYLNGGWQALAFFGGVAIVCVLLFWALHVLTP